MDADGSNVPPRVARRFRLGHRSRGARQSIRDRRPRLVTRDSLYDDGLDPPVVEVVQRREQLSCIPFGVPRKGPLENPRPDVLGVRIGFENDETDCRAMRRKGVRGPPSGPCTFGQQQSRTRRIVARIQPRRRLRLPARQQNGWSFQLSDDLAQHRKGDRTGPQDSGTYAANVDDGRLDPGVAWPSVEQEFHPFVKLLQDVRGDRGRQASKSVRARRSDRFAERGDQGVRDRVARCANGNGAPSPCNGGRDTIATLNDHREWSRPERASET